MISEKRENLTTSKDRRDDIGSRDAIYSVSTCGVFRYIAFRYSAFNKAGGLHNSIGKGRDCLRLSSFIQMMCRFAIALITVLFLVGAISPSALVTATSGWSSPVPVAPTDGASESSSLVIDGTGKVYVIWAEGSRAVYYTSAAQFGFTWTTPLTATSTGEYLYTPFLSVDRNNRLHMAWSERETSGDYDIYYSSSAPNTDTWSTKLDISDNVDMSIFPVIVTDGQSRPRVAWTDRSTGRQQIHFRGRTENGTTWTTTQNISSSSFDVMSPDLAVDVNNDLHATWHSVDAPHNVFYSYGDVEGESVSWSTPITVSSTLTGSQYSRIVAKGTDLYVVWSREVAAATYDVYFSRWTQAGGWTLPAAVTQSRVTVTAVPPYNLVSSNPDLVVDSSGSIHLVWHGKAEGDDKERVYYSRSSDSGSTWSNPTLVSGSDGPSVKPSLGLDANNAVYVAWQDYRGGTAAEIYFASTIQRLFLPLLFKGYAGGW